MEKGRQRQGDEKGEKVKENEERGLKNERSITFGKKRGSEGCKKRDSVRGRGRGDEIARQRRKGALE